MQDDKISSKDFQKLIKTGVLSTQGKRVKVNPLLPEYLEMLKKDGIKTTLFTKTEYDYKSGKDYKFLTIRIPGEPVPKQSVRFMVSRYFQDGVHDCPYTGESVCHKKGDVVTYRNKNTNNVDCIVKTYSDSTLDKIKENYQSIIRMQLPEGFIPFSEEVHIIKMDFVFSCLKSFSDKKVREIKDGAIVYKNTRGDLDNHMKLVLDSMNNIIYKDDSIIISLDGVRKFYGTIPKIEIHLKGF